MLQKKPWAVFSQGFIGVFALNGIAYGFSGKPLHPIELGKGDEPVPLPNQWEADGIFIEVFPT